MITPLLLKGFHTSLPKGHGLFSNSELNYSELYLRSHHPLNPEEHRPGSVAAAGDDHPFFLHPGKVPPEAKAGDRGIDVMPGPGAEADRHGTGFVDLELLFHFQTVAVGSHGLGNFGQGMPVDLFGAQLLDHRDLQGMSLGHDFLLFFSYVFSVQ